MDYSSRAKNPRVLVISCMRQQNGLAYQVVGDKYLRALVEGAGVLPLMLPLIVDQDGHCPLLDDALALADGLFLPGSYSNVSPDRYDAARHPDNQHADEARDALALAAIPRALALNLPVFAVCRGMQELNVAQGGTLHQSVRSVEGYDDHREDPTTSLDAMYAPAHAVTPVAGACLASLLGQGRFQVNSLHAQGIDRLGAGLTVEAHADDGLIEAISVTGYPGFAMGVQWHPEWQHDKSRQSQTLFRAFGDACRDYRARRQATVIDALIDASATIFSA